MIEILILTFVVRLMEIFFCFHIEFFMYFCNSKFEPKKARK